MRRDLLRRARTVVLVVSIGVIWSVLQAVGGPPASAAPLLTHVGTFCAGTQNGSAPATFPTPLPPDFALVVDVTTDGPSTLSPNQPFSVQLGAATTLDLHTYVSQFGVYAHITKMGPFELRLKAPANATFTGHTVGAPGNVHVTSVTQTGGEIVITSDTVVGNYTTWTQTLTFDQLGLNFTAGSSGNVALTPGGAAATAGGTPASAPAMKAGVLVDLGWQSPTSTGTPANPTPVPPAGSGISLLVANATSDCQAGSTEIGKQLFQAPILAPSVNISNPAANATFQLSPPAPPQFGSATCANPPPGGGCQGRIDDGPWFPLPDSTHALNTSAGAHTFSARMVDGAGQPTAGVADSRPYTVQTSTVTDIVPPTVVIDSPLNGAVFTTGQSPFPTYQFSCADPSPGTIASCVGAYAPSANGPWTVKAAGSFIPLIALNGQPTPYVFRVVATDQAGNTTVELVGYTVLPGPQSQGAGFNCSTPLGLQLGGIAVTPIGVGAWNNNNCVPFQTNVAPPQVAGGSTFTWTTWMGKQVHSPANVAVSYTFKTTGGTFGTPVIANNGTNVTNPSASLAGNDLVVSMVVTGNPFTPPKVTVPITATAPVGSTVTTRLTKVTAGNAGVNPTWIVPTPVPNLMTTNVVAPPDTTPPTIAFASPAHGSQWPSGTPIPVAFSCFDAGPPPTCVADPAGTTNGTTITPTPGAHTISVTSVDAAGNTAYEQHTFYVVAAGSQVSLSGCSAVEATDCTFTVSVTPPSPTPVTLTVTATPASASIDDFGVVPTTVSVPANTSSVALAVPTTDDALVEPTETFSVELSNPQGTGVTLDPTAASATGSIEDWNTSHQCAARWPAALEWQVDWAIDNLPGGDGTVDAVIAAGFAYWLGDLSGTTVPLDPGYVAAIPPSGTGNVTYPASFTQAFSASTIAPLAQVNGMTCDDVLSGALYLGVLIAYGSQLHDPGDGGTTAVLGGTKDCVVDGRSCAVDERRRDEVTATGEYRSARTAIDTTGPARDGEGAPR